MPTLAEENKKILRRSLDVLVGMDIPFVEISSVTATGNYSGSSEEVNGTMQEPILMDLSNGGFKNDGLAIPLGDDTDGFVSEIGTNLVLTITLEESSNNRVVVVGYIGGIIHKWGFSGSGSSRTITIPGNTERIIVNRVICGELFWFDNSNLVSCNLQLRAVETKADNPELQMSEIEFEGYEPNDITDIIGYIGTGYPIYYTSGYPGDMAPMRKFYLGEPIEFEDKTVKIKGYDATYFLDDEYGGFFGNDDAGMVTYAEAIDAMLTQSGVDHSFVPYSAYDGEDYHEGAFLIDKGPKRSAIAQAVNIFRDEDVARPFIVNYVDAGIPKLWTGPNTKAPVILENISRPKNIIDPILKEINVNVYTVVRAVSSAIETIDVSGATIYEASDPYESFTVNTGTVETIDLYTCKIEASGSVTISGRKIVKAPIHTGGAGTPYMLPLTVTSGNNGVAVNLDDIFFVSILDDANDDIVILIRKLMARSNISYEFEYRGDPKLQPRDYIRADIDGSGTLVDMTIDTIELKHEGGGTSSTIVARKGFI